MIQIFVEKSDTDICIVRGQVSDSQCRASAGGCGEKRGRGGGERRV